MILAIFLFLCFLALPIAIIGSVSFKNTKKYGIEFNVSKKFVNDFKPEVGDSVNIWFNESKNVLNFYIKGSVGGKGKIGETDWRSTIKDFNNDLIVDAVITKVTDKSIFIKLVYDN